MSTAAIAALATAAPAATASLLVRGRRVPLLPVVLLALALAIAYQVVAGVGLFHLDVLVSRDHWRGHLGPAALLEPVAYQAQRLGQRGVILVLSVPVVLWLAVRIRSLVPVATFFGATLLFNVVVGALKVLTARPRPIDGIAHTFVGGTEFPSGHVAGSVVLWGTLAFLLHRYLPEAAGRRLSVRTAALATTAVTLQVSAASLYLDMHWLTDVLAAWAIGGLLLWLVVAAHQRHERPANAAQPIALPIILPIR